MARKQGKGRAITIAANMKLGPILGLILVCATTIFGFGLDAAQDKKTSPSPPPKSGAGTYKEYCAVCHGKSGKGDGPAASALKVRPPDLTTLARRHDGKFPDAYVAEVLRNGVALNAHGTAEMPIWGPLFMSIDSSYQSQFDLRISSLTKYIQSLQK
jgi:mono/diheme cytochrome c family protein